MLAVEGEDFNFVFFRAAHDELSRHYQKLLVSEGYVFACFDCGKRGFQSRRSDDRRDNRVGFGQYGYFHKSFKTAVKFAPPEKPRFLCRVESVAVENRDVLYVEFFGYFCQLFKVFFAGDADHIESVAVASDDFKRVVAD